MCRRRRFELWIVAMVGIALAVPVTVEAQQKSIFTLLPTDGRVLGAGFVQEGRLDESSDFVLPGGQSVQAWELRGSAGDGLVIELASDDFDALLYLTGPDFDSPLQDDDGGEGCNSRIDVVLPSDGPYLVIASTFAGSAGSFTLSAASEAGPRRDDDDCTGGGGAPGWDWSVDDVPTDGRSLVDGDEVQDQLTQDDYRLGGDSPAKGWSVLGTAGMTLTIDMISDDFDAILYMGGPGLTDLLVDDDGAGRCDARLTVTFPEDGEYTLVASTIFGSASGAFTLRVSSSPGPPSSEGCGMGAGAMAGMGSTYEDIAAVGVLEPGEELSGALEGTDQTLADGSYVDAYTLSLESGAVVTIDLIGNGFDAILAVTGPADFFASDDDSLGSCNSRLVLEATESGDYKVVVNSIQSEVEGTYILRTLDPPGNETPGACM